MGHRKFFTLNESSLSYFELGDKNILPTILILHGWGLSASVYLELAKLISDKNHHVLVVDLPGFGFSSAPNGRWDYYDYATCISEFIKATVGEKKKVTILGHSFGGGICLALANRYSSQIEKMILVDSAGIPMNLPVLIIGAKKIVDMLIQLLSVKGFVPSLLMILSFFTNILKNPVAMFRALDLPNKQDLTPILSEITVPVNILWAKKDIMVSKEKGQLMAQLLKSPIIFVSDTLYHDWCITHPMVLIEKLIL